MYFCGLMLAEVRECLQPGVPARKSGSEPLYTAKVFSYIHIIETILLSSVTVGMSTDFHLLAIRRWAACRMLQTSLLLLSGIDSIFKRRRRKNSGPEGHGTLNICVIRPLTLSQKGVRWGQDQNMWRRKPTGSPTIWRCGGVYYSNSTRRKVPPRKQLMKLSFMISTWVGFMSPWYCHLPLSGRKLMV